MLRLLRWPGRILAVLLLLLAGAAVLTPLGRYISRAAWEEGKILLRRRPIAELVGDSATAPALRSRLSLVLEARKFAVDSIGLKAEESFTTYSTLDRDTLVLVLSASPRDTLVAHTWWFPVVGRFPYKGFFDFAEAQETASAMRSRGLDTYLRPASAFSTLGWFDDPLLSTTVRQAPEDLVNTVVHELLHNTVFVKGHVVFNESFASFVGARGAVAFYAARNDSLAMRRVEDRWSDDIVLGDFWADAVRAVDSVFAIPGRDSLARIAARDTVYARVREQLRRDVAPGLKLVDTTRLAAIQLDNASLLARRTYARDLALFDEVHRKNGGDLRETIALIGRVASLGDDPFTELRRWLEGKS